MVNLEDIAHLPLVDMSASEVKEEKRNYRLFPKPVEIAEIGWNVENNEGKQLDFMERFLVYVSGRTEVDGQNYVLFSSKKKFSALGYDGIYCKLPQLKN